MNKAKKYSSKSTLDAIWDQRGSLLILAIVAYVGIDVFTQPEIYLVSVHTMKAGEETGRVFPIEAFHTKKEAQAFIDSAPYEKRGCLSLDVYHGREPEIDPDSPDHCSTWSQWDEHWKAIEEKGKGSRKNYRPPSSSGQSL